MLVKGDIHLGLGGCTPPRNRDSERIDAMYWHRRQSVHSKRSSTLHCQRPNLAFPNMAARFRMPKCTLFQGLHRNSYIFLASNPFHLLTQKQMLGHQIALSKCRVSVLTPEGI
jgi:hypothetical protein